MRPQIPNVVGGTFMRLSKVWIAVVVFIFALLGTVTVDPSGSGTSASLISLGASDALAQRGDRRDGGRRHHGRRGGGPSVFELDLDLGGDDDGPDDGEDDEEDDGEDDGEDD
jgi:hypothetical protein